MKTACSTSAFKTDLETALRTIAKAGFTYVDLIAIGGWDHINVDRLTDDYDSETSRIDAILRETGLIPIAMNCAVTPHLNNRSDPGQNARRLQQAKALARLVKHLNVPVAGFYPGFYNGEQGDYETVFNHTMETWVEIQKIAADEGVDFVLEPHFRTPLDTVERVHRLFDEAPTACVTYDPTHFIHDGSRLEDTRFMLTRSKHIHVRDANTEKIHVPLGKGDLKLPELAQMVREEGYSGNASIEYLPGTFNDPVPEMVRLRDQLEDLFPQ